VIAVELSVRKLAVPPLLAALPDMIKLIYGINLIDVIAAEEVDRMLADVIHFDDIVSNLSLHALREVSTKFGEPGR